MKRNILALRIASTLWIIACLIIAMSSTLRETHWARQAVFVFCAVLISDLLLRLLRISVEAEMLMDSTLRGIDKILDDHMKRQPK